ncbi:MAG: hypothetical protein RIG61_10485 [Deltaproteobacteria bacterium]
MSESEKEETNKIEEESQDAEVKKEAESAEEIESVAEAKETGGGKETKPEEPVAPEKHDAPKKGLMERRDSFKQSSVPNAHKGYSGKPPVVMLLIIVGMFIVSYILAALTG